MEYMAAATMCDCQPCAYHTVLEAHDAEMRKQRSASLVRCVLPPAPSAVSRTAPIAAFTLCRVLVCITQQKILDDIR